MQSKQKDLDSKITKAFVRELEAFKRGGYKFNGTGRALFPGTQHEAFDAYLAGVKNNTLEGYFEIPTGVGKTALFIAIIGCYLRATENIPDAPRVLIHEPTDDLVVQTARSFADFMPDIAARIETDDEQGNEINWQSSSVGAKRKGAHDKSKKIVITTYQGQAADERIIEEAGLLTGQARKLCRHISRLDSAQTQQACDAINAVLKGALEEPITPDSIKKSSKALTDAIGQEFSDDPSMADFLEAVRQKKGRPLQSYQPTPDKDKAEAIKNRTYKPEEFHLVIHDEAHYLTGEKYGPAAVDKFHGTIQLGVTATPEYSVSKTVANKLGHRYYHLPLTSIRDEAGKLIQEGAIERGDLCHVRPILIKTRINPKIDIEKAREYFAQQKGRPLTNKQLEQLLNQEARNKAIIKAYLTGAHPDTGERFLGQTGMIFAGGITHCGDFIRDANKVLDQTAYRDVKRWLRDEGLCLIAPIHSQVPDEGVEITLGGKKRRCTKDEIKELHRQGKILLLISDQELKLGTDFPMDSFIADAVDRFSVPDAAQRIGRGFRVDRGNERLDLPANPNKSCAALNVIDETTHDMYEGTPHYPIHAIEILHGAEHRPPGRRKGALTRFKSQPPEVTEGIEELGFEFINRMEAIREVSEKFKQGKKKKLPEKTDDDLTLRLEVPKALKIDRRHPKYSSWRTQVEADLQEGKIVNVGEYPILEMDAGHGIPPWCVNRKAIPILAQMFKIELTEEELPIKTGDDLTLGEEVPKALKISPNNKQYLAWRTPAEAKLKDGKEVKVGKYSVQKMLAGTRNTPYCLTRKALPALAKELNIQLKKELAIKTEDWLSEGDMKTSPDGWTKSMQRAFDEITGAYDEEKSGLQAVQYKGKTFDVQQLQAEAKRPICISKKDRSKFIEISKLPDKTDALISKQDLKKVPGAHKEPIQAAVDRLIGAYDEDKGGIQGIPLNGQVIRLQQAQSGSRTPVCIFSEDWPKVERAVAMESAHAADSLKSKPPTAKSIKPGSGNLKRTGRSRTLAGEKDDE